MPNMHAVALEARDDSPLPSSVRELTTAIASGNAEAFARFFKSRFNELYAEARRCTGRDESFCLDVVQDAMLRVIRSLKPMDTEEHLTGWLKVVIRTCAYDRLRKEIRRRRIEQGQVQDCNNQTEINESRPSPRLDTIDHIEARVQDNTADRLVWLRKELELLPRSQAGILLLKYRFGWTLERIGRALGLKPGAVDGRINRTVAEMRQRAQETFDESR